MITRIVEATNRDAGGFNWGKFLVGRFDQGEWERRSVVDDGGVIAGRGWAPYHVFVMDLQTGEGAMFRPGGYAKADLDKHKIWVCPLFEPFLTWLYEQDLKNLDSLPTLVQIADPTSSTQGYRRPGRKTG